MPEARFSPATQADAEALRDCAVESFRPDLAAYGAMPPGIDDAAYHARHSEGGAYLKITWAGAVVGGILLAGDLPEDAEIALFFIAPSHQSRGIGAAALAEVERRHPEVRRWRLVTPADDARNAHFYERHGYVARGRVAPTSGVGPVLTRYEKPGPGADSGRR